jgi:hypothetical protein
VILSHPLAKRRRHQKNLIAVTANEVQSHHRRLPTQPDGTPFSRQPRTRAALSSSSRSLSLRRGEGTATPPVCLPFLGAEE